MAAHAAGAASAPTASLLRDHITTPQIHDYWRVDAQRSALADPLLPPGPVLLPPGAEALRAGGIVPHLLHGGGPPPPHASDDGGSARRYTPHQRGDVQGWKPEVPPPSVADPPAAAEAAEAPRAVRGAERPSAFGPDHNNSGQSSRLALDPSFRAWRPGSVAAAAASAAVQGRPQGQVWAAAHLCGLCAAWLVFATLSAWQLAMVGHGGWRGPGCDALALSVTLSGATGVAFFPFAAAAAVLSVHAVWMGDLPPAQELRDLWAPELLLPGTGVGPALARVGYARPLLPALAGVGTLLQAVLGLLCSVNAWAGGSCTGAAAVREELVASYAAAAAVALGVPLGAYIVAGPRTAGKEAERARSKGQGSVPVDRRALDAASFGARPGSVGGSPHGGVPASPRFAGRPRFDSPGLAGSPQSRSAGGAGESASPHAVPSRAARRALLELAKGPPRKPTRA